jgi:large conductance mechanosensitive channel
LKIVQRFKSLSSLNFLNPIQKFHSNFSNLFLILGSGSYPNLAEAKKAGVPVLCYGAFLSSVLDFVIVAFCIFIAVRWLERFRLLPSLMAGDAPYTRSEKLLEEIRDELRERQTKK